MGILHGGVNEKTAVVEKEGSDEGGHVKSRLLVLRVVQLSIMLLVAAYDIY